MSVRDDLPKLREQGLHRYQPARHVLPDDRPVFVEQKVIAAGDAAASERSEAADDRAVGIADEGVGSADRLSELLLA